MYEFHGDWQRYFDIQTRVTREHIIPFIQKAFPLNPGQRVLEIGCGEAGVLLAFLEQGYQCTGIELEDVRLERARNFMPSYLQSGQLKLLNKNIYDVDVQSDLGSGFDLIILKDVIEHIPEQEKFIPKLQEFLNPGGMIFFAFPPWQMPFGGHQQVLPGKWASRFPYMHLLPSSLYKVLLRLLGQERAIPVMMEIKSTGISIERFERIVKKSRFVVKTKQFYLFNPIYQYKFNLKARRQNAVIAAIPWLRNFFTMGVYYLVGRSDS